MIQVKRLAHATFSTPDLDQQIDYWTQVVGLAVLDRGENHCFLATQLGEEVVALERGAERGFLRRIAFQVKPGSDLGELAAKLNDEGIQAERRTDISPGVKQAIVFTDPMGTMVEVYADYTFSPSSGNQIGVSPMKFGHVASRVHDAEKMTKFYCDILGFRVSDWIGDRFSFLRCGVDHHSLNFIKHEQQALLHIAFELRDRSAVFESCQYLTQNKIPLVFGPTRHVVGHNISAYHRNPDNIRVEFFTEMDLMADEELGYWEPRPWHEEMPLKPKVWPDDTLRCQWGFGSTGTFPGYP
ncbi:MAG: bleomycin resistance protein [Caulobacteraceae bacterium]|nr:bleomycin resistance protein [Caulobacteraceae bacterium]